ncbi:hypothetical protein [Actinokineospora bangkokensis]|uniref:Uncharacterized protein n=1 Tax=Actinokineospora bangkokensis TaxID=1193682 RepID=A0A1Q9LLM7_9PSEU|nr:hypothetical protein [Actinokineospora bangkokensis]OLR92938.1 hypothetical protein BJP25_18365 [Actinokineospora bangkokensis]
MRTDDLHDRDPRGGASADRVPFAFDARFRVPLALAGVTPSTAWVELGDDWFTARFGPWVVRTPTTNLAGARLSGPFAAWKAVGARLSLADRGLTFGSSTDQAVCVRFHVPVTGIEPLGLIAHPALTATVADPEHLLRRIAALTG